MVNNTKVGDFKMVPHNKKGRSEPTAGDLERWNSVIEGNAYQRGQKEVVVSRAGVEPESETEMEETPSIFDEPTLEDMGVLEPEQLQEEPIPQAPTNDEELPSLAWIQYTFKTKSAAIRYLLDRGIAVKEIAKHLGIRYQHVRNVMKTPLKRGPNEAYKIVYIPQPEPEAADDETPEEEE